MRRPTRLDLSVLGTLYRYELKMLLRDRRTLLIAVLAPLILFPAMILVMRMVEERERESLNASTFRYAVTGREAALARALVQEALALPADSVGGAGAGSPAAAAAEIAAGGATGTAATFFERRGSGADSLLEAGELHLIVEGLSAEEYRREREREEGDSGEGEEAEVVEGPGVAERAQDADDDEVAEVARGSDVNSAVPVIRLHYRADNDRSSSAANRLAERLREVQERHRDRLLAAHGFPVAPAAVASIVSENVASAEEESGALLGLFLTPLLVMLMLSGGSIVAVDAITGEKERGTLEALLTTAAHRGEIVASKQLAVITVGVSIAVINVLNLLAYLGIGLIEVPARLAGVAVGPGALAVLLLLFLPVAVLVSSGLLLLSGYSKSYKEYQVYFFPVFLLFLLPSFAAILPGLELRSLLVLVPLANVSVAVREVLTGEFDWPFLALAFGATSAAALWGTWLTSRALSTERLITGAELEQADLTGGPALFPRHVLRWFAVFWAVLLVASLWMGDAGIRGQVAFNLVALFLGGTILMIRKYRLDPRAALALRAPPPAAWPAVLIGVPSALVVGIGLSQLVDVMLPMPERMVEAFGQFLLPEDMPLWQVLFFLTVLPGICEEVAFRGALLHGLRRRFSPVVLALVVGAVFGFFHVSLYRILPTAYLGAVLAAVVLLTGSIYPAMLWHALNNAIVLVPAYLGWSSGGPPPAWAYPVAAAGLAFAFRILWTSRSPYPGLRPATSQTVAPAGRVGS